MNLNLQSYTALVCGSTQGIGRAAAQELALLGAKVVLMARNETSLKDVCMSLPTPANQQHTFITADFSNPDQVASVINTYIGQGNPIHILVNNTGDIPLAGFHRRPDGCIDLPRLFQAFLRQHRPDALRAVESPQFLQ